MLKKSISFILMLCLTLSLSPCATLAENPAAPVITPADYVTLGELSAQALSGWHETYAAFGREVVANVDIRWMPDADACPIVRVKGWGERQIAPSALESYQNRKGAEVYLFDCSLTVDWLVESNLAIADANSYCGETTYDQPYQTFCNGETPAEKPENVDLSYGELLDRISTEIKPLSGLTPDDFRVSEASICGVAYKARKNRQGELVKGEALSKWGAYGLNAEQLFHGIPVVGYSGEWTVTPKGSLSYSYSSAGYYSFTLSISEETAVHTADVPLLSFDAMKRVLEEQIKSGHLRGVDEMEFGYMAFYENSRADGNWLLMPVWRILGGYASSVNQERVMPYFDAETGEQVHPQEYYDYFYNAQTGEMLPTDALLQNGRNDNAIAAGKVLTWEELE